MSLRDFQRPDPALVEQFREVARCYSASCVFADVQQRDGVMHSGVKPIFKAKAVGPALTVKLSPGDLQDPLAALHVAQPGDVVVVDAGGETETSVFGGLMGSLFLNRGVQGAVIDGACRDTDELRDLGFVVFSRTVTARGTHTMFSGRKDDVQLNVSVQCGGVVVSPGDMIVADEIGITVVPAERLEAVLAAAREQAEREEATRQRIREGRSFEQLLEEFGRI
ncbi:MAG: RraA family protein [Betaproteobacteria bacterium]|jgi:4-hydroxy-4-methyl-2-oxoglutarate aldolase|nr:RraA family protein [Rhodocyclaceae bacterium]MCA3135253.1 RraA family protein [Rhodocyclaceae bacterium]MCA3141697.1 RraA family protein [Rhodocyclaceae bacterium]MCA3145285.1 RraA family protein [Rhodocyclaceae bacterium]MCE2896841.1 RraA family protein [Betaproteobacteria bacterium]